MKQVIFDKSSRLQSNGDISHMSERNERATDCSLVEEKRLSNSGVYMSEKKMDYAQRKMELKIKYNGIINKPM